MCLESSSRKWSSDGWYDDKPAIILIQQLKQSPSLKAVMEEKLIVVFTMGDHLYGRDIRLDLESHNPAFEDVQDIWKDAKKRYVVFDNTLRAGDARREAQVQNLLHIVRTKSEFMFCHKSLQDCGPVVIVVVACSKYF